MSDENVLDLSGDDASDASMAISDLITEILVDMADAADLPAADLEEVRLQMSEVATIIMAELDLQVEGVGPDGRVTVTVNPKGL